MEIGTLKQLNAQPGDTVEYVPLGGKSVIGHIKDGRHYQKHADYPYTEDAAFRIVSRATPPVDLTTLEKPFGLLDPATQEALRAHGGPYEVLCGDGWCIVNKPRWLSWIAYRVKPAPIRETVKRSLHGDNFMGYVAIDLVDGAPDWGSLRKWGDE